MAEDSTTSTATPSDSAPPPDPNEGPGKGKPFFDRARTVAATGNFDYAIDMYIEGLKREPFNVDEHKALRDVAFNRKIKGGKTSGGLLGFGGVKLPLKGKTPKDAFLNAAFQLSKDIGNITHMLTYLRNAVILGYRDVVMWIGPMLKEANRTTKSPKMEIYAELAEIYAKLEEYEKACDAVQCAAELKPNDMELSAEGQRYAAMATIKRGKFDQGGDFKDSIKDRDATKKLLEDENLVKSRDYLIKTLETAKTEYEKNPMELQVIAKYSKALADMDDEEHENIAIQVLDRGYRDTKIYRLKAGIGDIRIKQFKRDLRPLVDALRTDPNNKAAAQQLAQVKKDRLAFELGEFRERSEHLPSDMTIKFELGVRLWESGLFDEAIVAFQDAQNNPKHRVDSMHLSGRSFLTQGMKPEAVDTLKRAIEEYDLAPTGDKKSKEIHYWYARSLEENGNLKDAEENYSKIIRWDIGYRDARKRLAEVRVRLNPDPPPST